MDEVAAAQNAANAMQRGIEPSPRQPAGGRARHIHLSRLALWGIAAVVTVSLVVWGQPLGAGPLCLALSVMAASALTAQRGGAGLGVSVAIPAGFLVLLAWVIAWGLVAGALGFGAWDSRVATYSALGLFMSGTAGLVIRRRGLVGFRNADGFALLGFVVMFVYWAWVIATQPLAIWSRVTGTGTDFLRHLWMVAEVRRGGDLSFGEASYPRAFHALGAWMTALLDVPTTADALWRAGAPVAFVMLGLLLMAAMSASAQLVGQIVHAGWPSGVAALLTAAAFLQTAWFSSFLAFGNVMNMLVAVALMTLLAAGLEPEVIGSRSGTLLSSAALVVAANSWQLLLPVVAAASVPWILGFVRAERHRRADWAVWSLGALVVLHGVLGLLPNAQSVTGVVQTVGVPTVSNLFRPDWWWWVALAFCFAGIVVAYRRGLRSWALATSFTLLVSGLVVLGIVLATGSSWELLRYYPAKALWTALVVVIPVAVGGFIWLVRTLWMGTVAFPLVPGAIGRGAIALVLGVVVISVVGRGTAYPPHLSSIGAGRAGLPNWSLALVDAMEGKAGPSSGHEGAIVFGLVPSAGAGHVRAGFVGMVDYMAMESLRFLGIDGADVAPVKSGLATRDMTQVCRYLKDFPDSLRVTGPNPEAGPAWIMDSGCPESIVQPKQWISLDIEPMWLERSPWEDGQWDFPRFSDVQAASSRG